MKIGNRKILWGGSAAAVCLTNCRTRILHAEKQSYFNGNDEMNECNEGMHDDGEEGFNQNRDGRAEDIFESTSDNSLSAIRLSSKEFQIKMANEIMQVQLCKHL